LTKLISFSIKILTLTGLVLDQVLMHTSLIPVFFLLTLISVEELYLEEIPSLEKQITIVMDMEHMLASTTAGTGYGVAKYAVIIAVKVLNCAGSGTWAGVNEGVEWTTTSHQSRGRRSVANMSLGGAISATTDAAVAASVAQGVNYAIAAGNSNALTCNYSPARVATSVAVGATTYTLNANPGLPSQDVRASFSNYGTCTKIFAPGQNIKAAWIGSNSATNVISGTSMASPHVAGVIAVYLGHLLADGLPNPSPAEVSNWIQQVSTKDHITSVGTGSPNFLLYSPYA